MLRLRTVTSLVIFFVTILCSPVLAERLKVGLPIQDSEPFVIKRSNKIEGMTVDIWKEIAQKQNIQYEWVYQDNYQDAIDAVAEGEIDIFVGPISITPTRLEQVEFTLPVDEFQIVLLVPSQAPSLWSRIKPFVGVAAISSLLLLILSIFIVGNLMWLAEKKKNPEQFSEKYTDGVRSGIWFAMVTLTTVGYGDKIPVTTAGRLIASVWMLITLIALSSITAGLASAFTVAFSDQLNERFTTIDDLRRAKIATVKGWSSAGWATYYGAETVEVDTLEEAVELVKKNEVDAFISARSNLNYYLKQNPNLDLSITNFTIATQLYGFALPKDSQLTNRLNFSLIKMREDAEIQTLKEKWF